MKEVTKGETEALEKLKYKITQVARYTLRARRDCPRVMGEIIPRRMDWRGAPFTTVFMGVPEGISHFLFSFRVCEDLIKEEKDETDEFLEEFVSDPLLRERISILSRTFANQRRLVQADSILFLNNIFTIEPLVSRALNWVHLAGWGLLGNKIGGVHGMAHSGICAWVRLFDGKGSRRKIGWRRGLVLNLLSHEKTVHCSVEQRDSQT